MKMKKMMFLMLVFLWGLSAGMNAQVTIGSSSEPAKSAVLDLNTGGSHDKGLLLPRLDLASATDISKLSAAPEIGLMVYATGDKTTPGDKKGLKEGVYSWDGVKWATGGSSVGIPVTGITVNPTGIIFPATDSPTRTLAASVLPTCANQAVTWESANPAIATVDENTGVVTPVSQGTTTITATSVDNESKTASSLITVDPVDPVTGITLDPTSWSLLAENETKQLTATIIPSWADNQAITWSSDYPNIAEVDGNGLVTAKAFGTATITATTVDGGKTATCAVEVMNHVASINLEPTSIRFNSTADAPVQLAAQILPITATNQNKTWNSSNNNVATVDQNGLVTVVGLGKANITVTSVDGSKSATCQITCYVPVAGVSISPNSITVSQKSTQKTVTPIVAPSNAYNKNVTWYSDDETVCTVGVLAPMSSIGVRFVGPGQTTIRVVTEDGGYTDQAIVYSEGVMYAPNDGTAWYFQQNSGDFNSVSCPSAFPIAKSWAQFNASGITAATVQLYYPTPLYVYDSVTSGYGYHTLSTAGVWTGTANTRITNHKMCADR
ncbi:hypothetical protein FACS189440_20920 [Bacteroidia bacterium]|nr:hypothetical protein FACS189440_20920 [Bacteroidia bacterium]